MIIKPYIQIKLGKTAQEWGEIQEYTRIAKLNGRCLYCNLKTTSLFRGGKCKKCTLIEKATAFEDRHILTTVLVDRNKDITAYLPRLRTRKRTRGKRPSWVKEDYMLTLSHMDKYLLENPDNMFSIYPKMYRDIVSIRPKFKQTLSSNVALRIIDYLSHEKKYINNDQFRILLVSYVIFTIYHKAWRLLGREYINANNYNRKKQVIASKNIYLLSQHLITSYSSYCIKLSDYSNRIQSKRS